MFNVENPVDKRYILWKTKSFLHKISFYFFFFLDACSLFLIIPICSLIMHTRGYILIELPVLDSIKTK